MTLLGLPQALAPIFIGLYLVAPFAGWLDERTLPLYIATLVLPLLMLAVGVIMGRRLGKRRQALLAKRDATS